MELEKMRKLGSKELAKEIAKLGEKLIQLQADVAMHKIKNFRSLRQARHEFAQLLTIQKEQTIISETSNE